ncbi:MAG: hypothetical protein K6T31_04660, partial [Alicyclobacillus sp.]|nr:hypothetical protein [Alicyclobacillus sp.]
MNSVYPALTACALLCLVTAWWPPSASPVRYNAHAAWLPGIACLYTCALFTQWTMTSHCWARTCLTVGCGLGWLAGCIHQHFRQALLATAWGGGMTAGLWVCWRWHAFVTWGGVPCAYPMGLATAAALWWAAECGLDAWTALYTMGCLSSAGLPVLLPCGPSPVTRAWPSLAANV